MKSINKTAIAAMLALCSAGSASAALTGTYHVTGSTAFRASDVSAEVALCGGVAGGAMATSYGTTASSTGTLVGANYSVVENSSGTLKFENYFNGSIAGDEALVDGVTKLDFPTATDNLPTAVTTDGAAPSTNAAGGNIQSAPTDPTNPPYAFENVAPDISFSDVKFDTAQKIIFKSGDSTTATPATGTQVGIVPFVFVYGVSSDVVTSSGSELGTAGTGQVPVLAMDPQKFTYIWNSDEGASLSFFTGTNADEAVGIYPLGRDVDSGTRATALAETGYGLNGSGGVAINTHVQQYFPYADTTDTGSITGVIGNDPTLVNPTIKKIRLVPAQSVDLYSMPSGDGGYNVGANLAVALSTTFDSSITSTMFVTYLGLSDASKALGASGTNRQKAYLMSYNGSTFYPTSAYPSGVTAAINQSAIYEGKYTFWSYEYLYSNSTASAAATALKGSLAPSSGAAGLDQLSSNGVTLNGMQVSRSDDGLNVQ